MLSAFYKRAPNSNSAREAGCLSHPIRLLKVWRTLGETLALRPHQKAENLRFYVSEEQQNRWTHEQRVKVGRQKAIALLLKLFVSGPPLGGVTHTNLVLSENTTVDPPRGICLS